MAQCLRARLRTHSLGSTLGEAVFFSLLYISSSFRNFNHIFSFNLFPFILIAALCVSRNQ